MFKILRFAQDDNGHLRMTMSISGCCNKITSRLPVGS